MTAFAMLQQPEHQPRDFLARRASDRVSVARAAATCCNAPVTHPLCFGSVPQMNRRSLPPVSACADRTIKQLEGHDCDHVEDDDVGCQDADGCSAPPPAATPPINRPPPQASYVQRHNFTSQFLAGLVDAANDSAGHTGFCVAVNKAHPEASKPETDMNACPRLSPGKSTCSTRCSLCHDIAANASDVHIIYRSKTIVACWTVTQE